MSIFRHGPRTLRELLTDYMVGEMSQIFTFKNASKPSSELVAMTTPKVDAAEAEIKALVLNLIEQSKEKDLPLHWLTGEIKKL